MQDFALIERKVVCFQKHFGVLGENMICSQCSIKGQSLSLRINENIFDFSKRHTIATKVQLKNI